MPFLFTIMKDMSFFSSARNRKTHTALVIDIGGGSVGAALVSYEPDQLPAVVYTTREEYLFLENIEFERFAHAMLEALGAVLVRIERDGQPLLSGRQKIQSVTAVYASPWFGSETQIVRYKKDAPFVVSESLLLDLSAKAGERFRAKEPTANVSTAAKGSALDTTNARHVLEQSIMQVRLNGYETGKPVGKKAEAVELTLFLSITSRWLIERVEKSIAERYGSVPLKHFACNHMLFSVLRDLYADVENFLFLHVGGEISDVSLVSHGILQTTVSFPFGIHTLIRRTARSLQTVAGEARTLLRVNAPKISSSPDSAKEARASDLAMLKRLEHAIADSRDEWQTAFTEALTHGSQNAFLPPTLFIVAESDIGAWFAEFAQSAVIPAIEGAKPHGGARQDAKDGNGNISVSFLREGIFARLMSLPEKGELDLLLFAESIFFGKTIR